MKKFLRRMHVYDVVNWVKHVTSRREKILRIYPTLRCNLKCNYCVNEYDPDNGKLRQYSEITAEQWLKIIAKSKCSTVVLTGGEPTLYKDFFELVNGIPAKYKVRIYSNMTFGPDLFNEKLTRGVHFLASYHPSCKDAQKVLHCIKEISSNGLVTGDLHLIDTPENSEFIKMSEGFFADNMIPGWAFSIDSDQRDMFPCASKKEKRKVLCGRKIILVAPDGVRYPCIAGMVSKRWALEDLKTKRMGSEWTNVVCDNWGHCAPCDGLGDNKVKFLS